MYLFVCVRVCATYVYMCAGTSTLRSHTHTEVSQRATFRSWFSAFRLVSAPVLCTLGWPGDFGQFSGLCLPSGRSVGVIDVHCRAHFVQEFLVNSGHKVFVARDLTSVLRCPSLPSSPPPPRISSPSP